MGAIEFLVHDDGLEQIGFRTVATVLRRNRARPIAVFDL
jgi:hypothetical protein